MAYRLLLLILLAVALAYLVVARQIPLDPWSADDLIGSRTLPTLYGMLFLLVLLALLIRPPPATRAPRHGWQALGIAVVLMAFVALVPRLGIWIALGLLLLGALTVMGERRPAQLAALSLGIPAGGWLLVERLLGIYVPGVGG